MPLIDTRVPQYKSRKPALADWNNFRKGLNTLLKETEIKEDELAQADNIVLTGKGVPTKRWGYTLDFLSGATGSVRGLSGYYLADGTNELVAITDHGYLTIKSNASYTQRSGVSWPSGYPANMVQLNDDMYIVQQNRELVRYSTPTLTGFPTISIPTSLFATQISGASGSAVLSYRVSSVSPVGETLAASAYALANQPQDPTDGSVRVQWSGVSTASVDLVGYNVYGRSSGDERFLGFVGPNTTVFIDDGSATPREFAYPQISDSTGGVKAKYIARFQDRLIYAGISGEPSKVVISGRVPVHERNDVAHGGNFIRIEPDAGDDITGVSTFGNRIVVFKERSIWEITLDIVAVGNFYVTEPSAKLITASHGCIADRSIVAVENDLFFLSRKGVYVLGYEPNLAVDVLRTNELSAKIRPFFDNLTSTQKMNASATYFDFKYILSFPGKDKSIVYDRERTSWVGPWTFDANVYTVYFDSSDNDSLLFGADDSANVYELSSAYRDDNGTAISTILRTRSEDFGDWTLYKVLNDIYTNWRNVSGTVSVDIRIQDRLGNTIAAKSFTLNVSSGDTGWGADMWGSAQWGSSNENGGASDTTDVVRWINLNKTARRVQFIVKTTNRNDNYELLSIRTEAKPVGKGFKGDGWRITN